MTTTDRRPARIWLPFSCLVLLVAGWLMMPDGADTETHIGYMLRVTARIAFVFLMLAYLARPVAVITQWQWLVKNRRYVGLSMAIAHTVHAGYVVSLFTVLGMPLDWFTIVFGGLAFVLMWLMAATSNNSSMRVLGRNWKRLHTAGLHYLWIVFMQSFVGAAVSGDQSLLYGFLSAAGFVGLALRIQVFVSRRRAVS